MLTFLKMIGAVFVALFLVVIAGYLFLRWKLTAWAQGMADQVQEFGGMMEKMAAGGGPMAAALGGMAEPLTITLRPTDEDPDEDFELQIKAWTKGLLGVGFVEAGDFEAEPTMLWMRALTHPETGAAAVLYIMPLAGCWFEVCARLGEKEGLSVGNSQQRMADMPPWSESHRVEPGMPPANAYAKLLRKVGERRTHPYTPENLVTEFEEAYRRDMLWRVKRGDTAEELKRVTFADGAEEPDSEFLEQLMDSRRQMRAHQIDELLKEQWLKESNVSAYDYERIEDRLVVVHELTPPDMLIEMWGEMYGEDWDEEPPDTPDVSEVVTGRDPQQAFRTLLDMLPRGGRYEHYAAIEGDIAGDLWLRPEDY